MAIRAVLLDMDGTIWDNPVDWARVRAWVGIPPGPEPILHHLRKLPPWERAEKERMLREAENQGATQGRLVPGAVELLDWLREKGILTALVTNNSRGSLQAVLARHPLPFDKVFSREDIPLKPDPGAFRVPLQELRVSPEEACVVGDSHMDLIAASRAGVAEVVLVAPRDWMRPFFPPGARFHEVGDLFQAREILSRLIAAP